MKDTASKNYYFIFKTVEFLWTPHGKLCKREFLSRSFIILNEDEQQQNKTYKRAFKCPQTIAHSD
jgi:hypothetical protein